MNTPDRMLPRGMSELTERQQRLIDTCIEAGWGWAKYAKSVQAQGWCSPKQQETLIRMHQQVTSHESRKKPRRHDACHDCDISDNEAMSLGEYF